MSKAPTRTAPVGAVQVSESPGVDSRSAVLQHATGELVFAVVGHVGSGTSTVAESLKALLEARTAIGGYDVIPLKARDVIETWAKASGRGVPSGGQHDLKVVQMYQDLGDQMRLNRFPRSQDRWRRLLQR
jgi:hypothetical protein